MKACMKYTFYCTCMRRGFIGVFRLFAVITAPPLRLHIFYFPPAPVGYIIERHTSCTLSDSSARCAQVFRAKHACFHRRRRGGGCPRVGLEGETRPTGTRFREPTHRSSLAGSHTYPGVRAPGVGRTGAGVRVFVKYFVAAAFNYYVDQRVFFFFSIVNHSTLSVNLDNTGQTGHPRLNIGKSSHWQTCQSDLNTFLEVGFLFRKAHPLDGLKMWAEQKIDNVAKENEQTMEKKERRLLCFPGAHQRAFAYMVTASSWGQTNHYFRQDLMDIIFVFD